MTGHAAAFFDMDHTLIGGNSGALYMRYRRRLGKATRLDVARTLWWVALYRLNLLDLETVAQRAVAEMEGEAEEALLAQSQAYFDEMVRPLVFPESRHVVEDHRRRGHLLAVLSASTPYAVAPLAQHLGIEHVICTRLEVGGGRFTGRCITPLCFGRGKIYWTRRFAEERDVDLSRSYFYTDSYSDRPLLELVGHQVAVNPDLKLGRLARRQGWPILRFRLAE